MPRGGLNPWPKFRAWVTTVRKKWLSLYYSTFWWYIHQTYTNCSSWHDLLMPRDGLYPWPTFHVSVTKTQNCNSGAPVMVPITIMSNLMWFHIQQYVSAIISLYIAMGHNCPVSKFWTAPIPWYATLMCWTKPLHWYQTLWVFLNLLTIRGALIHGLLTVGFTPITIWSESYALPVYHSRPVKPFIRKIIAQCIGYALL